MSYEPQGGPSPPDDDELAAGLAIVAVLPAPPFGKWRNSHRVFGWAGAATIHLSIPHRVSAATD